MFHFPALPPRTLCIQMRATAHDDGRVSPFGNPRITARLPAPRGLSQAPTSFIGSWCQDIHRMLLKTWLITHKDRTPVRRSGVQMLAFTVQFSRYGRNPAYSAPDRDLSARPLESAAPESGCFLRTQQRARLIHPRSPPFRSSPAGESVLTGNRKGHQPNSQCSTRKHGHPATRSVTRGAGAP
jgi:hypothetical protein